MGLWLYHRLRQYIFHDFRFDGWNWCLSNCFLGVCMVNTRHRHLFSFLFSFSVTTTYLFRYAKKLDKRLQCGKHYDHNTRLLIQPTVIWCL